MMRLDFCRPPGSPLKILCLGAHSDDIEIGCGGTILRLLKEHRDVKVDWIVFSGKGDRAAEAKESADRFTRNAAERTIVVKGFRDGFFPYTGVEIKEHFEELKASLSPHVIFTHSRGDLHQDHRVISELTWNTFRDHFILEYEVIKYDGDLGTPNFYAHLDESVCREKIATILDVFRSQRPRRWFTDDVFLSILRLRGMESNAPERYAEGFYSRKSVV